MNYDFDLLKKPSPFQEGNMTLWDNEYIAQSVLKKHLDKNIDSGTRKESTVISTIQWIDKIISQKGKMLDVGCGPGLYADLLQNCGFKYHGIDISKYQVEYAKKKSKYEDTIFEVVDFRKLSLSNCYDCVLMLYGIYSFYKFEERIELLKIIKDALLPGGSVIVETFTKYHYLNRRESRDWTYIEKNGFWSNEPYLELNAFYRFDDLELVLVQAAKINSDVKVWNSWIQIFTVEKLQMEFRIAGFTQFEIFSSCTGDAYNENSEVLCMVAR